MCWRKVSGGYEAEMDVKNKTICCFAEIKDQMGVCLGRPEAAPVLLMYAYESTVIIAMTNSSVRVLTHQVSDFRLVIHRHCRFSF